MIVVNSRGELKNLINRRIEERGPNCDLNDIDVSRIRNMRELFIGSNFNGDISQWDVSGVKRAKRKTGMRDMFKGSPLANNKPEWCDR